jgi:hypothetical protein
MRMIIFRRTLYTLSSTKTGQEPMRAWPGFAAVRTKETRRAETAAGLRGGKPLLLAGFMQP